MREQRSCRALSWLLVFLVTTVSAVSAGSFSGQTRPFTAEDMLAIIGISGSVAVSFQGDRLAYVLPDPADEWNVGARPQRGAVYVQRITGREVGPPRRVGLEGQWSSFPAFSPDGVHLAFYVTDAEGSRLALWTLDSGRTQIVGARFTGTPSSAPMWASDDAIVYARTSAEPAPPEPPRVQVLESTDRILPGDAFFRSERRSGLAVFDVSTGAERTLIDDHGELRRFAVAPDGRHALVSAVVSR
jgi:dipeptidyl aminopeptidase/acylaminoacyl peptidase